MVCGRRNDHSLGVGREKGRCRSTGAQTTFLTSSGFPPALVETIFTGPFRKICGTATQIYSGFLVACRILFRSIALGSSMKMLWLLAPLVDEAPVQLGVNSPRGEILGDSLRQIDGWRPADAH